MAEMQKNNLANENETLSADICPADSKNKKEKFLLKQYYNY